MKLSAITLLFSCLVLFTSCATTERTTGEAQIVLDETRPSDSVSDDKDYFRSLGDYLQRVPGVQISGQQVIIRGVNSFNSGVEPLFVLDGNTIGSSYVQANNLINVRDIDYVRVLKGADAAVYGVRGGNGVIEIVTRK